MSNIIVEIKNTTDERNITEEAQLINREQIREVSEKEAVKSK